jgi:hypothetical protein
MADLVFVPAPGQRNLRPTHPIVRLVAALQSVMAREPSGGWSCGSANCRMVDFPLSRLKGPRRGDVKPRRQRRLTIHVTRRQGGHELTAPPFWGSQAEVVAKLQRWLTRQQRLGHL